MLTGKFPEGLRVLVYDEDFQNLISLEKHLQYFQYKGSYLWYSCFLEVFETDQLIRIVLNSVTICNEGADAMHMLRNHMNTFDIAIIEAQNSAVDIFRLISEIASEIDLPIISKHMNQ